MHTPALCQKKKLQLFRKSVSIIAQRCTAHCQTLLLNGKSFWRKPIQLLALYTYLSPQLFQSQIIHEWALNGADCCSRSRYKFSQRYLEEGSSHNSVDVPPLYLCNHRPHQRSFSYILNIWSFLNQMLTASVSKTSSILPWKILNRCSLMRLIWKKLENI